MNILRRLRSLILPTPSPQQVARQLRQPSGMLGRKVGEKMNEANESLYDFTLECMDLADGEAVLEIGFGNGKFFDKIFAEARDLKLAGIDFSSEMMKAATRNNRDAIAAGRLDLRFGSSEKLPFPDAAFDKVFCINVIYFWEDPAPHLKEILRVLKPGGKFYASIRQKQTMDKMPFTRYGFVKYTEEEWEKVLEDHQFAFQEVVPIQEPAFAGDEERERLLSLCFIAVKPVL
jgi:ubiquinone/menaquinone biosynthesis C-methylase UbiE